MITTLLWDIDGVFVDTEKLHYEAWLWLAREYGKEFNEEEYAPMIGRGAEENMADFSRMKGITEEHSKLQQMRRGKYKELRSLGIPVIEENVMLARKFKEEYPELLEAAVSSARRSDIEENLEAAGLKDFFKETISCEDRPLLKRKPAPDLYMYACEVLGCAPDECLAFEDSLSGIESATAAHIQVLRLPTASSPKEILRVYN